MAPNTVAVVRHCTDISTDIDQLKKVKSSQSKGDAGITLINVKNTTEFLNRLSSRQEPRAPISVLTKDQRLGGWFHRKWIS